MAETLEVARRDQTGKRRMRRMRAGGDIPAVLYGHGQETVTLSIPAEQLAACIRHGARMVDLTGAVSESALIREIQWDTFATDVLHVDLTRVDKSELVEVTLAIELRGVAPGTRAGGVVQQPLHEVDIECPAGSIPENIEVNINHLQLDQAIHTRELELPEKAKLLTPEEQIVVQCVMPTIVEEEEEAVPGEGAEPEVIGKADEEEGDED